jgi:ArsR family transcriptional regulator
MKPLYRLFKALADPSRLRILNLLLNESLCVCELGTALDLPQPSVSRHLAYLRSEGLVTDCRLGMRVQYSVTAEGTLAPALQVFLRRAFESDPVFRSDLGRWEQRRGECCVTSAAVRRKVRGA